MSVPRPWVQTPVPSSKKNPNSRFMSKWARKGWKDNPNTDSYLQKVNTNRKSSLFIQPWCLITKRLTSFIIKMHNFIPFWRTKWWAHVRNWGLAQKIGQNKPPSADERSSLHLNLTFFSLLFLQYWNKARQRPVTDVA